MKEHKITLLNLPKISLNKWYAGSHWTKRLEIKRVYETIIKPQFKKVFPKTGVYKVSYDLYFKGKLLDCSNCVAMVKLIEDVIFEDDKPDIVTEIKIRSMKDKNERVEIKVDKI